MTDSTLSFIPIIHKDDDIYQMLSCFTILHSYTLKHNIKLILTPHHSNNMVQFSTLFNLSNMGIFDKKAKWQTQYLRSLFKSNINKNTLIICSEKDDTVNMVKRLTESIKPIYFNSKKEYIFIDVRQSALFYNDVNLINGCLGVINTHFSQYQLMVLCDKYQEIPVICHQPYILLHDLTFDNLKKILESCIGLIIPSETSLAWLLSFISDFKFAFCPSSVFVSERVTKYAVSELPRQIQDGPSFLLVKPVNGLCNRLRAIISCKILALKLRIPLLVYWTKTEGFDNSIWTDLFLPVRWFNFVSKKTWYKLEKSSFMLSDAIDKSNGCMTESISNVLKGWYGSRITMILSSDLRSLKGFLRHFPSYNEDYVSLFNSIKPAVYLQNKINDILSSLPSNTVGFHIRRGDAMNVSYKSFYEKTSDDYFKQKVDEVIQEGDSIYLSTDSQYMWDFFIHKYPHRVYGLMKEVWRNDKTLESDYKPFQHTAVIEIWVLRSLEKFYGTSYSSFSYHAGIKQNIIS